MPTAHYREYNLVKYSLEKSLNKKLQLSSGHKSKPQQKGEDLISNFHIKYPKCAFLNEKPQSIHKIGNYDSFTGKEKL